MNSHKFALSQLVALAGLLLCCPTAWCQRFETSLYGNEFTCNQISRYDLAGNVDLENKTEHTCKSDGSTASASSSASLSPPERVIATSLAATELLYVQEGQQIVTYSVNNTTAVSTKLGTLNTAYSVASPINIYRSGSFLYVLGFSPAQEYFSVYSLTAAGVPNAAPVQILIVKPALSQFIIHPNGTVAYAMFSWTQTVSGNLEYASDIVLFTINPKTGILTNTTKAVANFPLNDSLSTAMHGMSSTGTKLYAKTVDFSSDGMAPTKYFYLPINAKTGKLGGPIEFWQDDTGYLPDYSVFSDSLIVQAAIESGVISTIDIYPNAVDPHHPLFTCTSTMLPECGDSGYDFWMHPSGKYFLFADETTNETPIVYINTNLQKLQASGASIPGNPNTVAFSPDGLLVYAIEGSEISVYVFNPHSGLLTARTTINAPGVGTILPVK